MNSGKPIDEYIENSLGKSGIISLDVGTIIDNTEQWLVVNSYCDSSVASLHKYISQLFVDNMGSNEPINYLYDIWKDSKEDDEIVIYSFSKDGFINYSRKEEILALEKDCIFSKYVLTNQDSVSISDCQVSDDLAKKLEDIFQTNNQKAGTSSFDKFIFYQEVFTKLVLTAFNDKLKHEGNEIRYVTIVLLRKNYDGKWHLSYNAAIFSNNLSYLEDHAIYLLFDYFSRGNYLKEIESLKKSVKKESIKSAKSAIMSRNMSHNLGSHFISNTKNYFNALIDVDNDNEAIYRGVKYALQYIQERMDFIATVTSDDKYPFGSVNAKAQIFDELTPDDLGKRHEKHSLNFLMDYLVLSEKISKRSHLNCEDKKPLLSDGKYELKLIMGYEDKAGNVIFWDSKDTTSSVENQRKDDLVNINFAIPGGILGRHALFSIIENIIRNAAKHGQDKINGKFEIKMLCTNDDYFIIFDNKRDPTIRETVKNLNDRLFNLKMYNDDNTLNQDNKGLKEILICAAWLQNADFAQILSLKEFDKYVQILALDKCGKELKSEVNEGYLGYKIKLDRYKKIVHLNNDIFGISNNAEEIDIELLKTIKADIICASKDYRVGESVLSQICPHFALISLDDFNKMVSEKGEYRVAIEFLRSIVEKNCHIKTNGLQMVLSSDKKNDYIGSEPYPVAFYDNYIEKCKDDFLYKVHAGKSKWSKFETLYLTKGFEDKYIDSISGGDFTYTVVQPSFVKDEYNLLKIYESVKTRFVIIDERVYEQCRSSLTREQRDKMLLTVKNIKQKITSGEKSVENLIDHLFQSERGPKVLGHCDLKEENKQLLRDFLMDDTKLQSFLEKDIEQHYLERKNIHIFSFDNHQNNYSLNDISGKEYGHFEMTDSELSFIPQNEEQHYFKPCDNSPITFLSIHLGLIDKIKDNLGLANDIKFNESLIVDALKSYFGATFVSIHSGRGGFDVRNTLKKYVFQSYSAVENPLHNSKFLLAQQFYNLIYYGSVK